MTEKQLPVLSFSRRLGDLSRTHEAVKAFYDNPESLTTLFVDGFNQLVETFNSLDGGERLLTIMPGTKHLKELLRGKKLPLVGGLPQKSVYAALVNARELMIAGEENKKRGGETVKEHILIASSEAEPEALFVASAAHFLERTYFDIFDNKEGWKKDEVIAGLVDCMVLLHVRNSLGEKVDEPTLFPIITTAIENGGIGWKKQSRVDEFMEKYKKITQ